MTSKQKDVFLNGEGDAWFERNHLSIEQRQLSSQDPMLKMLGQCRPPSNDSAQRLLEIGCGEGKRLQWISANLGIEVFGIDPSGKAVTAACQRGISAIQGTADDLPYEDGRFDYVVFGFCLYLCDREDLFRIASEANRILKPDAWVLIQDFFSLNPVTRKYHHKDGLYSHKMDFRRLFDWHPAYTCYAHEVNPHGKEGFIDDPDEWVATSLLRKRNLG